MKLQKVKGSHGLMLRRLFYESNLVFRYFIVCKKHKLDVSASEVRLPLLSEQTIDYLRKIALKSERKNKCKINYVCLGRHNTDFKIDYSRNRIHVNNLGSFRVLGLKQFAKRGTPVLLYIKKRVSGYFFHVHVCIDNNKNSNVKNLEKIDKVIAIDFGLNPKVTFSNGISLDFGINVDDKIRFLIEKRSNAKRKNKKKIALRLARYNEKVRNQIKDIHRKIQHYLSHYTLVIMQDDYIRGWENIQESVSMHLLSYLKKRLKNNLPSVRVLGRYEVTSSSCFSCGGRVKQDKMQRRKVHCPSCGWTLDRDLNATLVMIKKVRGYSITDIATLVFPANEREREELKKCFFGIKNIVIKEYFQKTDE